MGETILKYNRLYDTVLEITNGRDTTYIDVITDRIIRFFTPVEDNDWTSRAIEEDKHKHVAFEIVAEGERLVVITACYKIYVSDDLDIDIRDMSGGSFVCDYTGKRTKQKRITDNGLALLEAEGHSGSQEEKPAFSVLKKLDGDEKFYGLGDKTGYLNKAGYEFVNWNTDYPQVQAESVKALYKSIPFVLVLKNTCCYGLFFDNTYRNIFNMAQESRDYFAYHCYGGDKNYYFIGGNTLPDIVSGYTYLTGTTPLPQLFTLGHQQSRWGYSCAQDILEVAKGYRDNDIPCDVIHFDIDYMDGYRVFTFDENSYGKRGQIFSTIKEQGFKSVCIIDPGVKKDTGYFMYDEGMAFDYFTHNTDGTVYENAVWPGDSVFPDFGKKEVRDWWASKQQILMECGVDGVWNDMNEPASFKGEIPPEIIFYDEDKAATHAKVHNIYGHNMARATYQGIKEATGKRPFVITRACYSGSQKYTTVWTGDNMSLWAHIQMAIPQLCNLGLSGISFAGTDIGGFYHDTTEAMMCRWVQLGAFSPLFRNHSALGCIYQEPWRFSKRTMDIYREAVKLRYSLIPYFYDLFYTGQSTGLPVIRPLVLHYQNDVNTHNLNDEFMVGENLLVAPVVNQGETVKKVYLPAGNWYDFYTGKEYEGGKYYLVDAPLEMCPVFAKEGAIIPTYEVVNYVGEKAYDTIRLIVFPGQGEYIHYQDNGTDYACEQGEYNLYRFTSEKNGSEVKTELIHEGYEKYGEIIFLLRGYGLV